MNRLKEKYTQDIVPSLVQKFDYSSVMQTPKVEKIVINMGVGDAVSNAKNLDKAVEELQLISGQKPLVTKAKKSVAGFRLREGMPIGTKVTLRGDRMYDFLDKLVNVSLPRVRDFHGVSKKAFDGRGNYTLGIKEQLIFPEVDYDSVDKVRGMDIVIVTTANTDEESLELLTQLGVPFKNKRRRRNWLKSHKLLKINKPQNIQYKNILAVNAVVVHVLFIVNFTFAVFASAKLVYKGQIPGVKKASW